MLVTPRRSARGTLFTPSPHTSTPRNDNDTEVIYRWLSSGHAHLDNPSQTNYTTFTRITPRLRTPGRGKKSGSGPGQEQESRFGVGDGVMVGVDGGDGVGILVRLWEQPKHNTGNRDADDEGDEDAGEEGAEGTQMMAEVHWCFRRQDLPGVMKNLGVEDNEVLLAASPIRPVSTSLPVALLQKTVPIYSRQAFNQQFQLQPTKSVVKGWTYIRQGVYWCDRALDKGAKGGKAWKIDVDTWKGIGRAGGGWVVPPEAEAEAESEPESESEEEEEAAPEEEEESADEDENENGGPKTPSKKRKATVTGSRNTNTPSKRPKASTTGTPRSKARTALDTPSKSRTTPKKMPHPKSSTSRLPPSIVPKDLPTDPYQRALRLLHVGATPESLPCREEEFVDVLGRVEEGVEGGGGGCLYIAGVPGTGKTATVHAVVKELKRKAEDGELPPFSYVEINGLKIPSPQHAYTVLWEAISGAKGASSKTALWGLEGHFGRQTTGVRGPRGHTFVVLMDELDQLLTTKQDVVYNFFNWPTMRDSQLFVIAVANRMDLPQHLAAKIKSRLGLQTVLFQPYDRTALIEIVQSRLIPHPENNEDCKVLSPDAIALAATRMAGTNGDARRVLDACRRAVEVSLERPVPVPVTAKEMMRVLNDMSSSPVALFLKGCSVQQKVMLGALVRCVRREGLGEIPWRSVRADHDALTRSLLESNDLLSPSELALVLTSLLASHALTWAFDPYKALDDRKVALGMEISEVGRVLMAEGEGWRRALAGT